MVGSTTVATKVTKSKYFKCLYEQIQLIDIYFSVALSSISARAGGMGSIQTEWLSFHEANQKNLGHGDKPDYFQLKGTIHMIKNTNAVYKACPQADCNKKVVDMENGQFRCEKCNVESPNFKYRMMLNVSKEKLNFSISILV